MSSIRDSLKAAMSGEEPDAAAAPAEAAAPLAPVEPVAGAEPAAPEAPAEPGPARGPDGKFAPKEAAPAAAAPPEPKEPEPAKPADTEPQSEAIRVPPSLPAAVKAKFGALDKDVQEAFAKLEDTVQTSKAEWGRKAERLNRWDEILAPRRDYFAIRGIDEYQGVQILLAAQDILDRDPYDGIRRLAHSYGVDLRHFSQQPTSDGAAPQAQPQPGQQPGVAAALPPEVLQELQTLRQTVTSLQQDTEQRSRAETEAKIAEATREITAFSTDPKNLYFENVKPTVIRLLESGQAATLQDAYEQAIWASPEIRPLLLAEQQQTAQRKAQEDAQRQRAAAAQHAAGSIAGAPTPGAQPAPGPFSKDLRQTLVAAFQEHAPGV